MTVWAKENGIDGDLKTETDNMLDHYRAKGELRCDWIATWRTWMRRTKTYGYSGNSNNHSRAIASRSGDSGRLKVRSYKPTQ